MPGSLLGESSHSLIGREVPKNALGVMPFLCGVMPDSLLGGVMLKNLLGESCQRLCFGESWETLCVSSQAKDCCTPVTKILGA